MLDLKIFKIYKDSNNNSEKNNDDFLESKSIRSSKPRSKSSKILYSLHDLLNLPNYFVNEKIFMVEDNESDYK